MRVSDAERQRVIDELRRHCAAGRLDIDEFAARIEKAMTASSIEDLDHLRADLPMIRIGDPAGHRDRRIWAHGTVPDLLRGAGSGSAGPTGTTGGLPASRAVAVLVVLLSVSIILAAIALSVIVSWSWAILLLAGWAVGLAQGRLRGRAHA
jgi:hypothetical protein